MELMFLVLILLIIAGILFFIVRAVRGSQRLRNRGPSEINSSDTYNAVILTDYSSSSDAADATSHFGDEFGGGDAGGGGSGGDWSDAGGADGGGGDGGGGDGGGGGE